MFCKFIHLNEFQTYSIIGVLHTQVSLHFCLYFTMLLFLIPNIVLCSQKELKTMDLNKIPGNQSFHWCVRRWSITNQFRTGAVSMSGWAPVQGTAAYWTAVNVNYTFLIHFPCKLCSFVRGSSVGWSFEMDFPRPQLGEPLKRKISQFSKENGTKRGENLS